MINFIEGGLGNMLFQFAFAITQSEKFNADLYFANYHNNLNFIKHMHGANIEDYSHTIFRNLKSLNTEIPRVEMPIIQHHCPFEYHEAEYEPECINFYKGYYQSELFFDHTLVHKTFGLSDNIKNEIIKKYSFIERDCVAMHVRRGDYLNLPNHHPVLDVNYYNIAINNLKKDIPILLFTNDKNWCKEHFSTDRFIYIDEKDWMSLYIMSLCNYHIIANSSFSWWGAKLAEFEKDDVQVIAPNIWFGTSISHDLSNLVPGRWHTI